MHDPDGYMPWLLAGALIGAAINVGMEAARQVISGEQLNLGKLGVAALSGAASGALMASGAGLFTSVVGNSAISIGTGIANDLINGNKITAKSVATNAVIGGVAGLWGGKGARFGETTQIVNTRFVEVNVVTDFSRKATIKSMRVATSKTVITAVANPFVTDSGFRRGYFNRLRALEE